MNNIERERKYQIFKEFRDEYYNEHKRNPYACHAFTRGFEVGQQKATDEFRESLRADLFRIGEIKKEDDAKNELIKDMMHLLEQTIRDDVTKFTKYNMTASVNRAKKLLNMPLV